MTLRSSIFGIGGKLDSKLCGGSKLGSVIVWAHSFLRLRAPCNSYQRLRSPGYAFRDCGHPANYSFRKTAVTLPAIWPFLPTLPLVSTTAVIVPTICPFRLAFCRLLLRLMAGCGCAKPDTCLETVREPPLKIHWLHLDIAMIPHKC